MLLLVSLGHAPRMCMNASGRFTSRGGGDFDALFFMVHRSIVLQLGPVRETESFVCRHTLDLFLAAHVARVATMGAASDK